MASSVPSGANATCCACRSGQLTANCRRQAPPGVLPADLSFCAMGLLLLGPRDYHLNPLVPSRFFPWSDEPLLDDALRRFGSLAPAPPPWR